MLRNASPGVASRIEIIPKKKESRLQALKFGLKLAFWRMPLVESAAGRRRGAARKRISHIMSEAENFISLGGEEVPADLKKSIVGLSGYERKILWEHLALFGDRIFGEWASLVLEKNRELVFACYEDSGKFRVKRHMYQPENLLETRLVTFETKGKIDRLLDLHQVIWPGKEEDLGHKRFEAVVDVGTKLNFIDAGVRGYTSSSG